MLELLERFASIAGHMEKLDLGLIALSGILHGRLAGGENTLPELSVLNNIDNAHKNLYQELRDLLIYEVNKTRNQHIKNLELITTSKI